MHMHTHTGMHTYSTIQLFMQYSTYCTGARIDIHHSHVIPVCIGSQKITRRKSTERTKVIAHTRAHRCSTCSIFMANFQFVFL